MVKLNFCLVFRLILLIPGPSFYFPCYGLKRTLSKEQLERANSYLEELNKGKESWVDPSNMFSHDKPPNYQNKISTVQGDKHVNVDKNAKDKLNSNINAMSVSHHQDGTANVGRVRDNVNRKAYVTGANEIVERSSSREVNSKSRVIKSELVDKTQTPVEYLFLSRWLKKFLMKVNLGGFMSDQTKIVSLPITVDKIKQVQTVLDNKIPNMQDVESVLSDVFSEVTVEDEVGWFKRLFDSFSIQDPFMFLLVLSVVFVAVFLIIQFSAHPRITSAVVVITASFCWHWMKLYKKELAKKHAKLEQLDFHGSCKQKEFGVMASIYHFFKSFLVSSGECTEYFEAVMVDPFWEVSPSRAISDTLSTFIFHPMEVFVQVLNASVKSLFSGLSVFHSVIVICFICILLLLMFNYRLRLPFFLAVLEPSNMMLPDTRLRQQIGQQVRQFLVDPEQQVFPDMQQALQNEQVSRRRERLLVNENSAFINANGTDTSFDQATGVHRQSDALVGPLYRKTSHWIGASEESTSSDLKNDAEKISESYNYSSEVRASSNKELVYEIRSGPTHEQQLAHVAVCNKLAVEHAIPSSTNTVQGDGQLLHTHDVQSHIFAGSEEAGVNQSLDVSDMQRDYMSTVEEKLKYCNESIVKCLESLDGSFGSDIQATSEMNIDDCEPLVTSNSNESEATKLASKFQEKLKINS